MMSLFRQTGTLANEENIQGRAVKQSRHSLMRHRKHSRVKTVEPSFLASLPPCFLLVKEKQNSPTYGDKVSSHPSHNPTLGA